MKPKLLAVAADSDENLPAEIQAAIAAIGSLDESALRVAARSRFTKKESDRLAALHHKRQKRGLTLAENKERRVLMRRYEQSMVIGASALGELQKRGIYVSEFISP